MKMEKENIDVEKKSILGFTGILVKEPNYDVYSKCFENWINVLSSKQKIELLKDFLKKKRESFDSAKFASMIAIVLLTIAALNSSFIYSIVPLLIAVVPLVFFIGCLQLDKDVGGIKKVLGSIEEDNNKLKDLDFLIKSSKLCKEYRNLVLEQEREFTQADLSVMLYLSWKEEKEKLRLDLLNSIYKTDVKTEKKYE